MLTSTHWTSLPAGERVADRHRGRAAGADADGVNLDAHLLGQLGRLHGIDVAGVVLAVGEQDQHFALDLLCLCSVPYACRAC